MRRRRLNEVILPLLAVADTYCLLNTLKSDTLTHGNVIKSTLCKKMIPLWFYQMIKSKEWHVKKLFSTGVDFAGEGRRRGGTGHDESGSTVIHYTQNQSCLANHFPVSRWENNKADQSKLHSFLCYLLIYCTLSYASCHKPDRGI